MKENGLPYVDTMKQFHDAKNPLRPRRCYAAWHTVQIKHRRCQRCSQPRTMSGVVHLKQINSLLASIDKNRTLLVSIIVNEEFTDYFDNSAIMESVPWEELPVYHSEWERSPFTT